MEEKFKISAAQMVLLLICSRIMFAYTYLPVLATPPHNQDAWIVALFSTVYVLLFALPVLYLISRFPGVSFARIFEPVLGKAIGKACLFLLALFFLYCASACTLLSVVFVNSYLFSETPSWLLLLFALLPTLYAARKGAGTIARLGFFVAPYILLTVLLFLLLSLDQLDFNILKPVLADSSLWELNLGAFFTAGYSPETLSLLVLATYFRPKTSAKKILLYSTLLFSVAFMIMVIPTLTLLGLDIARHSWNPYYMFTRQVTALTFIQRVEALNVIAWYLGVLIKSALFLFMSCLTMSRVFGVKSHKPFVAPVCLVGFIGLLMPFVNRSAVIDLLRSYKTFIPVMLPFIVVLPLAVIAVYLFRRKKVDCRLRPAGGAPHTAPSS